MKKTIFFAVSIPVAYAIILRMIFGINSWNELFSVMSVTFLFLLPTIVGILTVFLSPPEQASNTAYKIVAPWIPVFLFLIVTIIFEIEGWACWIMILPIFLVAASFGGMIGGYLKKRKMDGKLHMTILTLLPLFISPMENAIETIPGTYEAYTFIDIDAPAEKIWNHVTRV